MIHAEEENPDRKINAGDGYIPPIPFAEAIDFLKARVPMTKKEWEKLEPKLRFRAFTVAKLGTAVEIETAKQVLISALEKGESYSQTWEMMNDIFGKGELGFKAGYWENVFRTNTQTAYMAGKLQQYEKTPGIAAYQLMIIEDVRTSKICRNLITKTGRGLVLSVDDDFWKTKGFPPYHFQCRSSVRAVYQHQLKAENIKIDEPKHLDRFKVGDGFGGNPLENGNWWKETDSQLRQAKMYGVQQEIDKKGENVIADKTSLKNENISTEEQNETLRLVSKIKEMTFFTEDIKADDREQIFSDLKKIQPKHAKILEKYLGEMRGDFYSEKDIAHYDPKSNKIILNIKNKDIRSTVRNFTTDLKTFLHESGHWLDENALGDGKTIRGQLPELKKLLEKDFINYCNTILPGDNQIKKIDDLFDYVELDNRLKVIHALSEDSALKSGIQDIISGLTGNGFKLRYEHNWGYWRQYGIEQEVIAHFFEANGSGGLVEQCMLEIFPSAYEYFNNFIGGL